MSFSPHSRMSCTPTQFWMRPSTIARHSRFGRRGTRPRRGVVRLQYCARRRRLGRVCRASSTTSSTYGMTSLRRETEHLVADRRCRAARRSTALCERRALHRRAGELDRRDDRDRRHATRRAGVPCRSRAPCVTFAGDANLKATAPRGRSPTSPSKCCVWTSLARIDEPVDLVVERARVFSSRTLCESSARRRDRSRNCRHDRNRAC